MTIGFLAMAWQAWPGARCPTVGPRPGGADRLGHPGSRPGAGEPGDIARAVSALSSACWSAVRRGDLRADDGLRDRLVRHPSRPRGVAGIGRHRHRPDDRLSVRRLARLDLRLADVPPHHRGARGCADDPDGACWYAARRPWKARPPSLRQMTASESALPLESGPALSPVHHPGADVLLLLRHAFRPDLPHGELRRPPRHPDDGGRHHLQRGRAGRHGRSRRLRAPRRPARRQAGARGRPAGAGVRRARVRLRARPRAFYAVAAVFGFIYAGIMPLYAVLARENFPLRMMGTVIGGMSMTSSLGMASGPLAGGLIFDTFASYAWLFIGSWAVGVGAFLISMTFRPRHEEESRRGGASLARVWQQRRGRGRPDSQIGPTTTRFSSRTQTLIEEEDALARSSGCRTACRRPRPPPA